MTTFMGVFLSSKDGRSKVSVDLSSIDGSPGSQRIQYHHTSMVMEKQQKTFQENIGFGSAGIARASSGRAVSCAIFSPNRSAFA